MNRSTEQKLQNRSSSSVRPSLKRSSLPCVMFSRQNRSLFFFRSKTTIHLHQIQSLVLKTALDYDPLFISEFIPTACSISIEFARLIFNRLPVTPSIYVWNSIIREYSKSPHPFEALKLFLDLRKKEIRPDNYTYPFVLKACGRCSLIGEGKGVHSLVVKEGFYSDHYVGNTLLSMYAACGEIQLLRKVFDEMPERCVVSWSSMIAGYIACNYPLNAIGVFRQMQQSDVKPNFVTLVSLLCACTRLGSLRIGETIHSYIIVNNIELNVVLGTAILEMYSKCGHIENAFKIFSCLNEKNLQTWTVMLCGYANHGYGLEAISLFTEMENNGLKPDSVSFSGILCACSHLGLVQEGQNYFDKMVNLYNIQPTMEHYGCMVDLFGRAGMVEEAYEIIKGMPMEPNAVILRSFIGACRTHDQVLCVDEKLKKRLLEIEPNLGANYVLTASVSAMAGQWDDMASLRVAMKEKGLKKVAGCSWVEVSRDRTTCERGN